MSLKERVYSVLLVSSSQSFNTAAAELLSPFRYQPVDTASSVSQAKRLTTERNYDFVIINSPLPDGSGARFSIDCCQSKETVAVVLARNEDYNDIYGRVVGYGVFALAKPVARSSMQHALSWMASARERLRQLERKTVTMEERMAEIRIINRAKWLLISELKMTEPEAHHYIEKSAMDNCVSKKEIAENIIKNYSLQG